MPPPSLPQVISELLSCHAEHPLRKFLGACNGLKRALDECLQREYVVRRQRNYELAQRRKSAYKTLLEREED